MALLTQREFQRAIAVLAEQKGLQRLRDRFVQLNALVTRRKVASPESLADQLYMLSSGLRRQVPATYAFHAVWTEEMNTKLGEDGEKKLEAVAQQVNACLSDADEILPDKVSDLDTALAEYQGILSAVAGPEMARLDMLLKAVPVVAEKIRAGLATPSAPQPPPES